MLVSVGVEPRDDVWPVYDAVFGDAVDQESWRVQVWEPHAARDGFRLAAASDDEQLVGFAYGYTGKRGQWWTDTVAATLPAPVAEQWLGGHFELVSVGVLEQARGHGLGRRLIRVLTETLPHDRWLLQTTDDGSDPARRLYASEGWRVLGPGTRPGVVVMGRTPRAG